MITVLYHIARLLITQQYRNPFFFFIATNNIGQFYDVVQSVISYIIFISPYYRFRDSK